MTSHISIAGPDSFKKQKTCVDRYDSSESSDSGVLTGSTCSESSSNSGNSDITDTDPCSPFSVTSFHLEDNGSPLAATISSSSKVVSPFPPMNSADILSSKMLPEGLLTHHGGRRNDVTDECWDWDEEEDKTLDWNDRYELTSDDIAVEVKSPYYFAAIEDSMAGDVVRKSVARSDDLKVRRSRRGSSCCSVESGGDGRKCPPPPLALLEPSNFNLTSTTTRNGFITSSLSTASVTSADKCDNRPGSKKDNRAELPGEILDIENETSRNDELFLCNVFLQKQQSTTVTNLAEKLYRREPYESLIEGADTCTGKGKRQPTILMKHSHTANECDDQSPPALLTPPTLQNQHVVDFFNILPSVFKGPILYKAANDTDTAVDVEEDLTVDEACESLVKILPYSGHSPVLDPHRTGRTTELQPTSPSFKQSECNRSTSSDEPTMVLLNNNNNNNNNNGEHSVLVSKDEHSTTSELLGIVDSSPSTAKSNQSVAVSNFEQTRFPSDRKPSSSDRICFWADCVDHISSTTKLIEHLQTKHVYPQTFSGTFICLWTGCKVFGRASCSRSFLERHVLSHGGNKPYRCIVDNCGQRFSSQLMLERHINQHFKTPKEPTDRQIDTTPKLIRRNGQKLRYRRQPYSVRNRADAFDAAIMGQLQCSLVQMVQKSNEVSLNIVDSKEYLHITFQPKVIGCRQRPNEDKQYLIRWYPYNSLEDEWLAKSEIDKKRSIPIRELPASVQQKFWNSIFSRKHSAKALQRQPRKYKSES